MLAGFSMPSQRRQATDLGRRLTSAVLWAMGWTMGWILVVAPMTIAATTKAAVTDPVGDTFDQASSAVDLTRMEATATDTEVVIDLAFAGAVSLPDSGRENAVTGFVDLDVDQNAATGGLPFVDFLTDFESGLGNEFYVPLATYSAADGRADLVAEADGRAVGRVPVSLAANSLSVRIAKSLIADDGAIHTAAVVGTPDAMADAVPNGGFVSSGTGSGVAEEVLLNGGRFLVEVAWRDFDGNRGTGKVVTSSDDSAVFWFFAADNWEMLVKVIDGCTFNDRFWVFSAATTNVEYTLTVTDTASGAVASYSNPLGTSASAVTDTDAFATCR